MTIDLTPEELETIIDALGESRASRIRKARHFDFSVEGYMAVKFRQDADRCAALSKRLGKLAEDVVR